jgi:small-conductance mechanosensitive channel
VDKIIDFFNLGFSLGDARISIKSFAIFLVVFFATRFFLKLLRHILTRKFTDDRKGKFKPVFGFVNYTIYSIIILLALQNAGVNLNALLAASAALLVGVGFALQTFFQDIISGVFILVDQSVHVGDIIEVDGKVGKVQNITLRTTRAVTIDNKVLIIPNHMYLTNTLYNWTENGEITRESIKVGVAYGSDVELVKSVLIEVAKTHKSVLKNPPPAVLFMDFGESSLDFILVVTLKNSFMAVPVKSDLRYSINEAFTKHNIEIPFPQRVVHTKK